MAALRVIGTAILTAALSWSPGHANEKTAAPPEHARVIVVGAGMAGMTAALSLASNGVDVILLEKEDVVGGKLESPLLGGVAANLGAQYYFPGVHPIIDTYLKSLPTQDLNVDGLWWKGRYESNTGHSSAPEAIAQDVNRAVQQMRSDFERAIKGKEFFFDLEPKNGEWDKLEKMDSYTYLSRFPGDVYEFFKGEIGTETGGNLRDLSAIVLVGWNGNQNTRRFILKGGNRVLIERMKDDFRKAGGRLFLKTEVAKVSQSASSVVAECADGRKYAAEYLIMATPAHVAKQIIPDLPAKKASALEAVTYLPMIELGLHINNFPKQNIIVWDEGINGIINQTGSVAGEPATGTVVSITITSPEMLRLDDKTLVERAATLLKKISPEFDPGKDILAYSIKRWSKGVFQFTASFASKYQKDLREPIGRIYFAGDYLNDPSLMGAAWAGSRAADGTMQAMKTRKIRGTSPSTSGPPR